MFNKGLNLQIISLEAELRIKEKENERLLKLSQEQLHIIKCQENRIKLLEDRFFNIYASAESIGQQGNDFFAHYISTLRR